MLHGSIPVKTRVPELRYGIIPQDMSCLKPLLINQNLGRLVFCIDLLVRKYLVPKHLCSLYLSLASLSPW